MRDVFSSPSHLRRCIVATPVQKEAEMKARWIAVAALLVSLAGSAWVAGIGAQAVTRTAGAIDPANFVSGVDNPYYPLTPGTTLVYRGVRDGQSQVDRVHITDRTKTIQGVEAMVVLDVARHNGTLLEKTFDWYAQDVDGNVWYLGEDTKEYDANGHVISTEGSWEAGVHHAEAGIIMLAKPQPPDGYRQEYLAGHAEDQAWVLSRGGSLAVPYGRVQHVLRTMEWTPLEPDVVDQKYYAPGLGIVLEKAVAGGDEVAKLVAVHTR